VGRTVSTTAMLVVGLLAAVAKAQPRESSTPAGSAHQDTVAGPRWILPTSRIEVGDSLRLWLFVPRADSGIASRVRFEVLSSPASMVELVGGGKCREPSTTPQAGADLLIAVCGIAHANGVARIVAWIEGMTADQPERRMVLSDPLSVKGESQSNAVLSTFLTAASGAAITIAVFLIQQSWTRRQDRKDRDQENKQQIEKEARNHKQQIQSETALVGKELHEIMIQEISSNRERLTQFLTQVAIGPPILAMRGSVEILANRHFTQYLNDAYGDKVKRFSKVYQLAWEFNDEARRHPVEANSTEAYLTKIRERATQLVDVIDSRSPEDGE
jgi:hypothetical protein